MKNFLFLPDNLVKHGTVYLALFLALGTPDLLFGQNTPPTPYTGTTINYMRTWEATAPGQTPSSLLTGPLSDVKVTTSYFDALGRTLQTVIKQASPLGKDNVTTHTYDYTGRETFKYLSFTSVAVQSGDVVNDGKFKPDAFQQQVSFFNTLLQGQPGETLVGGNSLNWAYHQDNYEASPLNRVLNSYSPGANWVGSQFTGSAHNEQSMALVNTAVDNVQMWNIAAAQGSIPVSAGAYPAGQLYKFVTTDEQGRQQIAYKDFYGQVILKKVQNTAVADNGSGSAHAGWLCTYYVYDDNGNQRFIISPDLVQQIDGTWAISQTLADELCFRFEYDQLDRMIIKKTPGTPTGSQGEVWMVYDARNRLVMTQDGNMRTGSQWLCYLFDGLDRPIMSGTIVYTGTFSQLQTLVTTQTAGNTSGTTSGAAPPSLQAVVNLSARSMSGDWQASQAVIMNPGFNSLAGGTFTAEIVSQPVTDPTHFVVVNNNPLPAGATFTPLTATFFDNYDWLPSSGAALSTSLNQAYTQNSAYFNTSYNTAPVYAQPFVQNYQIHGQETGQMKAVIGQSAPALYDLNIFDDRSRVIQSQSTNITGGTDIVTNQYDWNGKPLQNLVVHTKNGANPQIHLVSTIMSYDAMARLQSIKKTLSSTINGTPFTTPATTIAADQYDELGRLQQRSYGNNLETQVYEYNVNGWLLGMNRNYAKTASLNGNYFGYDLGYDKGAIMDNSGTTIGNYAVPVFNGDIAGTIWKTRGDNMVRRYDFNYDPPNRLLSADFNQETNGVFNKTAGLDFSVSNMGYDANGNITAMNQNGWLPGGSQQIDQLVYHYLNNNNNSNRLQNVMDNSSYNTANPQSPLGDLHYAGAKTIGSSDYGYDNNGNITNDFNRNVSSIAYNYLNQPLTFTFTNSKGNFQYVYDAAGNKLKKIVTENNATVQYNGTGYTTNITTTTTYINGFVYKSLSYSNPALSPLQYSDKFLFVGHEEGRIRMLYTNTASPNSPTGLSFDYFLQDHLGNVRMVLTDEQQTDPYPAATLEPSTISTEGLYYNISNDAAHVIPVANLPWWNSASGSGYANNNGIANPGDPIANATSTQVYKLNGATGDKYGLGITLKVMAGDQVSVFAESVWHNTGASPGSYPITGVLSAFVNAFAGPNGINTSHGIITGAALNSASATTGTLQTMLGSTPNQSNPTVAPKAAINWILFNDQFVPVSMGTDLVSMTGDVVKPHAKLNIPMIANGYLYVYCSNESAIDVYFDNLQVMNTRGPILEEAHYYPVGLAMAGISDRAWNKLPNFSRFQGDEMQDQEFSDGTGLAEYDFEARYYDQQLGLWHNQDPADQFNSPYQAMADNWPKFTDPKGKFLPILIPIIIGAVAGAFIGGVQADMNGQNVWAGIGKGLLVGGIGGALSEIGGGTFLSQLAWGAGEGAFTGALNSALDGSNIAEGALQGAALGAGFAAVSATVESLKNFDDGYGFGTNDGRLNHMLKTFQAQLPAGGYDDPSKMLVVPNIKGNAQKIADYFVSRYGGPPITVSWIGGPAWDPVKNAWVPGMSPYTDHVTGEIKVPLTEFYKDQNNLLNDFVHEQSHVLRSIIHNPDGTTSWHNEGDMFGGHGTIGYFDAIRQAGRYHIGLSAWLNAKNDAVFVKQAWNAFGWKKWFDVLPLRY